MQVEQGKYGATKDVYFELFEIDGVDLRTDWTPAAADTQISTDGGAFGNSDNIAVVAPTGTGLYKVVLSATEMTGAVVIIKLVDAATKVFLDRTIKVETYGNASAMHPFDLGTASVAQSADNETRLATNATEVGKIPKSDSTVTWNATALASIEAEAVDALESLNLDTLAGVDTGVAADGDLSPHVVTGSVLAHLMAANKDVTTSYNASTDSLEAIRNHIGDGTNLTEAGGDGDHLTAINLPNQTMDITGSLSGSVGSVSGSVGSVTGGATEAKQDTAQTDLDTITGTGGVLIGTDVMDRSGTLDVNTKTTTATALDNIVISDLAGMPTSTAKIVDVLAILLMALRNEQTSAAASATISNDAGAVIATAVLSDAAGTFTKAEYA